MPMGVRTPVVSMSMRVLMGIVKALVHPGNDMARFISVVSSSHVMVVVSGQRGRHPPPLEPPRRHERVHRWRATLRHSATGRRRTVVSTIVSGAGSSASRPGELAKTEANLGEGAQLPGLRLEAAASPPSMEMLGNVVRHVEHSPR